MAYLDLDMLAGTAGRPATATAATAGATGFSALEWSVIALARRDTPRSLGEPGRIARAIGGLFGLAASSRLADPRLEALRRMAVYAWRYGFGVPESEIARFRDAGFGETQVEALVSSVTGERVIGRRRAA